jgi:hypothetical protein
VSSLPFFTPAKPLTEGILPRGDFGACGARELLDAPTVRLAAAERQNLPPSAFEVVPSSLRFSSSTSAPSSSYDEC